MFKDKLKSDLDKLAPSENIKSVILKKLNNETPKKAINFKIPSVIAACLAVVIAIGVCSVILNNDNYIDGGNCDSSYYKNTSFKSTLNNTKSNQTHSSKSNKVQPTNSTANTHNYSSVYNKIFNLVKIHQKEKADVKTDVLVKGTVSLSLESPKSSKNTISENNYSKTNTQEENVDEEDVIKTDGKYIYRLVSGYDNKIYIYKADGKNTKKIAVIDLYDSIEDGYFESIFLYNNKLIVLGHSYIIPKTFDCKCKYCKKENVKEFTNILIYDISRKTNPKLLKSFKQSGYYNDSRMIGDILYICSNFYIDYYEKDIKKNEKSRYLPMFYDNKKCVIQSPENINFSNKHGIEYSLIASYNVSSLKRVDDKSIFGSGEVGYVSENNIYFTEEILDKDYNTDKTSITRFSINNGKIEKKAEGKIKGEILNQFSMDENNGYLRLVATQNRFDDNSLNSLCILDKNMKTVSTISKLAKGERIYSARFMGNYAYFVTFRETDPLFCADLSNPEKPKIVSKLKIPGFSEYLHPFGKNKLFGFGQSATDDGEITGLKLSMFDIKNPKNITEEDVTNVKGDYSEVSYNHKAIIISDQKNLIGFAAQQEFYNPKKDIYTDKCYYHIYSYQNGKGFIKKTGIFIGNDIYDELRGLYIGNYFYISTGEKIIIIDLKNYKTIKTL